MALLPEMQTMGRFPDLLMMEDRPDSQPEGSPGFAGIRSSWSNYAVPPCIVPPGTLAPCIGVAGGTVLPCIGGEAGMIGVAGTVLPCIGGLAGTAVLGLTGVTPGGCGVAGITG